MVSGQQAARAWVNRPVLGIPMHDQRSMNAITQASYPHVQISQMHHTCETVLDATEQASLDVPGGSVLRAVPFITSVDMAGSKANYISVNQCIECEDGEGGARAA